MMAAQNAYVAAKDVLKITNDDESFEVISGAKHPGSRASELNVAAEGGADFVEVSYKREHAAADKTERAFRMRSLNLDVPENAEITAENAELLARVQRYPYKCVDHFYERTYERGDEKSLPQDRYIPRAQKEELHNQWLQGVDIGPGWRPDKVLGRGGNGVVGKFDWHGVENDQESDRAWELAIKSICVKQSRAQGRRVDNPLRKEGDVMKVLNNAKSKHFPTMYNYITRKRGRNKEGLHIDHAEREVNQMIMEYCPGGDLSTLIKRLAKKKEGLPEFAVWSIFICLAKGLKVLRDGVEEQEAEDFELVDEAAALEKETAVPKTFEETLAHMHTQEPLTGTARAPGALAKDLKPRWCEKIHFDLKPENVFIGTKRVISGRSVHSFAPIHKIGDFGMMRDAVSISLIDRRNYLNWGTDSYWPPEQHAKYFNKVEDWRYTTKMNVYQVGVTIWCLMLRHNWPFPHWEDFRSYTVQKQYGEKKRIRTRGRGLERGHHPVRNVSKGGHFEWVSEAVPNFTPYSQRLQDLVYECLALDHQDRPDEDELLQRALGGFPPARDAYIINHVNLNIGQLQGIFDRLADTEPSPPESNAPTGSNHEGRRVRRKTNPPLRPNTPPRMHRSPPPDYWLADAAEEVRLYHQVNRARWDMRDAQIVAARKYIRHNRHVVGNFRKYGQELARIRYTENGIGCDDELISDDEMETEYASDSEKSYVDRNALPTSSGPRVGMGFDGKPYVRQWYFPGAKKLRELNSAQLKEAEARKLAELQNRAYNPLNPGGPIKKRKAVLPTFAAVEADLAQAQQQGDWQGDRGNGWGGLEHVAALKKKNPPPSPHA